MAAAEKDGGREEKRSYMFNASNKQRTVMCVDDNEQLRPLLGIILKNAGYEVIEAASCEAAKRTVQTIKPSLVILDVDLPDGSGLELAREWRQNGWSAPPILLISGHSNAIRQAEAASLNVRLLPKPFGPLVFLAVVESLQPAS